MVELPAPMEFLELADRHSVTFSVVDFAVGTTKIHPFVNGVQTEKEIQVIRVTVPATDKPQGVPYWDISSKRCEALLLPQLPGLKKSKKKVKITAFGTKPSTQFQVEVF